MVVSTCLYINLICSDAMLKMQSGNTPNNVLKQVIMAATIINRKLVLFYF